MKWLMLALVLITVGCTRMVYIPVESVKTEYINKMSIDSIRDSSKIFDLK